MDKTKLALSLRFVAAGFSATLVKFAYVTVLPGIFKEHMVFVDVDSNGCVVLSTCSSIRLCTLTKRRRKGTYW